MAQYEEIGGKKEYPKYKACKVDEVLVEGTFFAEIDGKYGMQFEYHTDCGRVIVLNGSGQLKHKMQWIRPGDKVKITYLGEELLKTGAMAGKSAHQLRVQKDTSKEADQVVESFDKEDTGLDEFDGPSDDLDGIPF